MRSYFYFAVAFDFASIYTQFVKLALDLQIFFKVFPWWVVVHSKDNISHAFNLFVEFCSKYHDSHHERQIQFRLCLSTIDQHRINKPPIEKNYEIEMFI